MTDAPLLRDVAAIVSHPELRIVVTGTTGAGKTTLARELSDLLGVEHLELDELPTMLRPSSPLTEHELRSFVVPKLMQTDAWILESDLSAVPPEAWRRATTVIWLDLARSIRAWRIIRRHGVVLLLGMRSGHGITRRRVLGDIRYAWTAHSRVATEYGREFERLGIATGVIRLRHPEGVESFKRDLRHAVDAAPGARS